jgi:glycosyltransferase involved in cell wall biosynthesis
MDKILFIKHFDANFILNDQKILEKHFEVKPFLIWPNNSGLRFIWGMLKLIIFILRNAHGSVAMMTWFGDYHSAIVVFFSRLLNKKVVIFAGGQEAICYPELKKGVYYKKFRSFFVKYALRNADLIIPNHKSLIYHENYYYDPKGKKDGMKYYIPDLITPIVEIPNGIDTTKFFRDVSILKNPKLVLTVGNTNNIYDFFNKGFDLFIRVAERNPDLDFVLIGIRKKFMPWVEENYHTGRIENLQLIYSYCPDKVIFECYNKANIFVQASITEGMPNTLSEAMLCECIPVGSNVNGIPDAIGNTGIIITSRKEEELEKAIHEAVTMKTGHNARLFVMENFTIDLREKKLIQNLLQFI